MRTIMIIFAMTFISTSGYASTWYVPDDYGAIQDAINAAGRGDTIIVRPGTYVEHIDLSGKAITLKSEKGPLATTIKLLPEEYTVVDCISGEGPDTVLEGFRILGPGYPWQYKHGMRNVGSSPTVTNVIFESNSNGMANENNSNPTVSDCRFVKRSSLGSTFQNFTLVSTFLVAIMQFLAIAYKPIPDVGR